MKKLILALVVSAFGMSSAAAYACDGMKGHEKAGDSSASQAKKEGKKADTKTDQKS